MNKIDSAAQTENKISTPLLSWKTFSIVIGVTILQFVSIFIAVFLIAINGFGTIPVWTLYIGHLIITVTILLPIFIWSERYFSGKRNSSPALNIVVGISIAIGLWFLFTLVTTGRGFDEFLLQTF